MAALIAEAENYLGYPYVWGGSNPSTSFDCSGFVCYVLTHSGYCNMPRTTALLMFDRASIYKEEFADYNSGFKDFCGYYSQTCEIDARKYAQQATDEYFERINEYLGEESTTGSVY